MTDQPFQAFIAGSRSFALSLLAPLAERIGARPRVAAHAESVLGLCGPGDLVVLEFQGEESLRAVQELVLQRGSLRIVAAVADVHEGAVAPLRALGVEPVRWVGKPGDILGAVSRKMAAAPPAARRPGPAVTAPSAPRPAAAVPPLRPVPAAPPAVAPSRAPAAPPGLGGPSVPPPPPPARAAAASFDDLLADLGSAEPAASSAGIPPSRGDLFDGLGADAFGADIDVAVDALDAAPAPLPSAEPARGPWPTNAPGPVEAADALGRGLAGSIDPPGTPLACVADVIAGLSELERAVFAGEPQPVDTEPIRRAAVMRVRVAAALAAAPRDSSEVDTGAVSALLAEIDALLSEVSSLVAGAPADFQPSLEAVRNALVKEAIDFSEAAQAAGPREAPLRPPVEGAVPSSRAKQARVVSVATRADREIEEALGRRRRRMFVLLGVVLLVGAAFHGYGFWKRAGVAREAPSRPGAPAHALVVAGPRGVEPVVVRSRDGKPFSPEEMKRLVDTEKLKGNTVRELAPGAVMIVPPGGNGVAPTSSPGR